MIKAVFFDIGGTVHTQDATPESDRDYKERLWRYLEEHGIRTADTPDELLEQAVEAVFDLRPSAIIRDLDLRKPIYRKLAAYGHMGREDLGVTWEKTDRTEALKAAAEA